MSEEVNKEQTKDSKQEKNTELSEDQLDEVSAAYTASNQVDPAPEKEFTQSEEGHKTKQGYAYNWHEQE